MQEIADLVVKNADVSAVKEVPLDKRVPFIEFKFEQSLYGDPMERIQQMESPRLIKTHLQYKQVSHRSQNVAILHQNSCSLQRIQD